MSKRQMFVFTIYVLMSQSMAGSESRFKQEQRQLNNVEQQQLHVNLNAWQPLTGHNNWLILQATAATSIQHEQQMQHQQHQLPVNYYAYNHRYNPRSTSTNDVAASGNYKQVRTNLDINDSPSYVLAISQTMRRGGLDVDVAERRQQRQPSPPPPLQLGLRDVQEVDVRVKPEVNDANDIAALTNTADDVADDVADGSEKPTASALDIDNYLAPFEKAVLKVRNFCDTLQSLISMDNDDDSVSAAEAEEVDDEDDGEEEKEELLTVSLPDTDTATATATVTAASQSRGSLSSSKLDGREGAATSKEVQGRHSRLAASYEGRKLKKLKKKIQKLLLPLLIAYKLKFLTLIPVLIGGLTLLVGTTGLAGFFFALFTAVMSLKTSSGAHGSKSIVLKKI